MAYTRTWNYIHDCECGRKWRVRGLHVGVRDKDIIKCKCGRTIKEWDQARDWTAELLEDPKLKRKNST
jgi:hypothetical protein